MSLIPGQLGRNSPGSTLQVRDLAGACRKSEKNERFCNCCLRVILRTQLNSREFNKDFRERFYNFPGNFNNINYDGFGMSFVSQANISQGLSLQQFSIQADILEPEAWQKPGLALRTKMSIMWIFGRCQWEKN